MKIANVAIFVVYFLFLDGLYANSDVASTCNKLDWQNCLLDYVDVAFGGHRSVNCSPLSSQQPCVIDHLTNCRHQTGPTVASVITPYINLLDRVHEQSCNNQAEIQSCDLSDAKSCIKDFMLVMAAGHLGGVCRQTSPVLKCLSPMLESCTGLPRYLVALVTDEIQLTSDFWCSSRSCRLDIASQCVEDGKAIIDYPVATEIQSNLICRGVKSSLACVTSHTELCASNAIPQSLSEAFMQLYQFSSAYCGTNVVMETMMSNVPGDLVLPVYLAALTTNEWTSLDDVCSIYNETVKVAAAERISFGTNIESLLTWQQFLSLSLNKLSDTCLNNNTLSCDWMAVLANESPVCDLAKAGSCVDMVLLSQLTVEVNLMWTSWETTCSVAYNMLACAQYHTGACVTSDLTGIMKVTQEIEDLVGYECSQVGAADTRGTCDIEHHSCESADALHECSMFALGIDNRCRDKDKIYSCFEEHFHHCNSAQRVPAQFYMEWLLNNCTHNLTLATDDIYIGVSRCKMQYGYNLYNGILTYSDFNTMICTATSVYRQCLLDQVVPSLATLYMQEVEDFYSTMQQTICNSTRPGSDLSAVTESEDCQLSETSSEITLSMEFYGNFPFMSLKDQEVVCRTYPPFKDLWTSRAQSCSARRQTVISDAIAYFENIHNALCAVSRPGVQRSCDVTKVYMCLEDFGAFTYFATENSDICGKLEETYQCLTDNTKTCDDVTHNALLEEVKTMHSLLGNITCPKQQWCTVANSTGWFPWQSEICSDWNQCLTFDWMSCVDEYNLYNCQFYLEGVACIEQKLSACDPLQMLLVKSEMEEWRQLNTPNCFFVPNDPPSITSVYKNMFECSYFISQTSDVSQQGLCTAINSYLSCLAAMDQSEVMYVWRGILGRNGQWWRKRLYLDCQISSTDHFIVGQDFNPDNITGGACIFNSQYCLRAFTSLAVTYFHLMPLSDRFALACDRSSLQYDCVMDQASGCTNPADRYLLTTAEWVREGFDNAGTCSSGARFHRECKPHAAMQCITELGHVLIDDLESGSVDTVCSKLQSTSLCVNQQTSRCDYYARADVANTFNRISAIVKGLCTPSPPQSVTTSCVHEGEATQCDLEEFLMCMVPVQAMLLHPNSTWGQICGSIPEMKTCIHRSTSGCDVVTMASVYQKLHRLSHRLNDQCPQFYCEECMARSCIVNLQRNLQYQNASLCGAIAEAKQCIYQHAGYCDLTIRENLLREITLLVGEDAYLCEITLPSCLQTFSISALQITNYAPMMNVSTQNDFMLAQMCNEANAAFYCVSQHLASMENQRLQVINSTLQQIGNIVYGKCQGTPLQCYSCVNATSNEDCNQQRAQTCSPGMQMCGTVFTGTVLHKGCVRPELCQNGCNGTMCSMCCGTNLCNQPWNNVISEPASCQPETALYCGFQLLSSLVQNDTVSCMNFQDSLSCMIQSTQSCMSSQSAALGIHARDLLTRDVMSTCMQHNPVCGCGQCTSMLLLSVVSSPFGDVNKFCRTVLDMYNRTLYEMDLSNCSMSNIQTTAYNLQMADYMFQGICSMQTIGNTTCSYNGLVYSHGASFMAEDGCNYCTCDRGNVACTLMYCPPDDSPQCPDIGPNQVGVCVEMCRTDYDCYSGQLCCSNGCGHVCTQPKPQGTDNCNHGNQTYNTGDSFLATDGCNFCYCYNGMVSCTEMYCPTGGGTCRYNGKLYNNRDTFQAEDGCNSCTCNSGNVACTLMYCPPDNKQCPSVDPNQFGTCVEMCSDDRDCDEGQLCCSNGCGHVCTDIEPEGTDECSYNGMTYQTGDSFFATDGCNNCFCSNGVVGCTKMFCPEEGKCDIEGVQSCIDEAALPYLMLTTSVSNAHHVCMSAASLLKCVESKIGNCPSSVLDIVHSAVWWNINTVQSFCDINDIIWFYSNPEWQTNTTLPDRTEKCSLQKAVECFSEIDDSATCSSYQSMIDCVYNFTTDCLTIDVVPVLFELEHHLEGTLTNCDLVVPDQNVDPFYPIAQCMMEFGASVNNELTLMYLRHGRLEGVCDKIPMLVGCLHNITNVQPAGKLFIQNLVESVSNLAMLCNNWIDENQHDAVTCHHCHGFTDIERCDFVETQDCHPNQVCATSLQLDPNSGFTMVTKGCADLTWCQMSHGCNPYFMSCVMCCHGDLCNSADNMTSHTSATNPWRSTTEATKAWSTTSLPHTRTTETYESCHIEQISAGLTARFLKLMTFHILPVYDRQMLCRDYLKDFGLISDTLDHNCPEDVTEHVQKLMDWLINWTSQVCNVNTRDERCMEAVQCVSDVGSFDNRNSTCRSISEAMDCLQTHYDYCNIQGQMSINSTRQILSGMSYVICEPNILSGDQEEIECVSMETTNMSSARCDAKVAMEYAALVEKAYFNPFMTQNDFCRIAKNGLVRIRDNSHNCSMETFSAMSQNVMQLIQGVSNSCPDVWCPVDDKCTMEPAWQCLSSLEADISEKMNAGTFDRSVCRSITRTHHCVFNATQNCSIAGTQRLFHHFNAIVLLVTPWCNEEPVYFNQCLNNFHHEVDHLMDFDDEFVSYILKSYLQNYLSYYIISTDIDDTDIANGIVILGLDVSLFQHFRNNTAFNLPGVVGHLFKSRNLNGINLPALSQFLGNLATTVQQNSNGSLGGAGLNLPGGGFVGGQDVSDFNNAGGKATDGMFGYGINLPGGYGSNSNMFIDKESIEQIIDILFRSEIGVETDVTNQILKMLNRTITDVPHMIDETSFTTYTQYMAQLCHSVHESVHCLYGNMHNILMTSSTKQEFVMTTTLRLLDELALNMCQVEHQCYSCNELHSNDECNMQPPSVCGPLQVCQARFTGVHFHKGCASALTCEEECRKADEQCYCCHGNRCNQAAVPMKGDAVCQIERAVGAAYDLLNYTTGEKYTDDGKIFHTKAIEMMNATDGCHSNYQRNFRNEGERIIKLLKAENCTKGYMLKHCNVEGLPVLTNMVASPYYTPAYVEAVCSLFDQVVREVVDEVTGGRCCDKVSVGSVIEIYHLIHPLCKRSSVEQLCNVKVHPSCADLLPHGSLNSSRSDSRNSTEEDNEKVNEGGSLSHMCSGFMYQPERETKRSNQSETETYLVMPACSITDAMDKCFSHDNDPVDCSDTAFENALLCVQNHTSGCSPIRTVPVTLVLDRLSFSCGRNMSSMNNGAHYRCLQELVKVNASLTAENSTMKSSVCNAMETVTSCLRVTPAEDSPLQSLYFGRVEENINRFTAFFCSGDKLEQSKEETAKGNDTCDITTIFEKTLHSLNFAVTSPFAITSDVCSYTKELENLKYNTTKCSDTLNNILSWIHKELKVPCDANMAVNLCHQPTCDVTMANDLLEQLGYFLLASSFDDHAFCQKVINVHHGVKCLTTDCGDEDLSSVTANVMYVKSIVGSRCPQFIDELFCDDEMQEDVRNDSTGGMSREMDRNYTRNATNVNKDFENCNVMGAKMCVHSVSLPSPDDGLYCSKMAPVIERLSDCVTQNLIGCDSNERSSAKMHYRNLFMKHGPVCYSDFTSIVFAQLTGEQCIIPQCSHAAAFDCLSSLKPDERKVCGNLEDVKHCVVYATEGCNDMQQFALMTSLERTAMTNNLPEECVREILVSENISSDGLTDCVIEFNRQISDILDGNTTGAPTCQVMTSLLTCLETTLVLPDIPSVLKDSASHLVYVTKPAVETVCKQAGGEMPKTHLMVEENELENNTCDNRQAKYCLKESSANVLLSPAFSQDGKQLICDSLAEQRHCLTAALQGCSDEETSPYYNIYSLIETIAQLSGVCSPKPVTCSPEIATECFGLLGHAISQHPLRGDTCWTLEEAKLCMRQTLRGCDSNIQQAVARTRQLITCKSHSICPTAFIIIDIPVDTSKSCVDPTEVVEHSGTCSPSTALRCLQDLYMDAADANLATRNTVCSNYPAALTCFFNNVNACEDDVTVMLAMFYLPELDVLGVQCSMEIKHGCDSDAEPGCDLGQMEECITHLRNMEESDNLHERCLAKEEAKHCFEISTRSCPRLTKLYAKTKFMRNTFSVLNNDEHLCDSVQQCAYNYMVYFNTTLSHTHDRFALNDGDENEEHSFETVSMEMLDPAYLYQCHARLEELSCIHSHLEMLPDDVAKVTSDFLIHKDSIFADFCAVQMGLVPEVQGCNLTCMQCLQNSTKAQTVLSMLLTFATDAVNTSTGKMFSSSNFCRGYKLLQNSKDDLNASCFDDPEKLSWQTQHRDDMARLFDKYCARPCNETPAAACIDQLKTDIATLTKDEICLSFNETLKCLEDSVMSCEANITNQYFTEAQTIFSNSGIVCYILPTFEVNYNASGLVIVEGGMSQQARISVTMATPVMDSCYGTSCYMELFISMEQPTTSECSSGEVIPQVLLDSCVFIFDANNTNAVHEFTFYPRVDHKVETSQNITVNVIAQLWEDGSLATGDTLASVTLMIEDRDTAGFCNLISQPTIKTFDGLLYYNFYQGEYILYQHDTFPEKVHVGFQSCRPFSSITCPCVVMVQTGDDTFILDRCRRFGEIYHALEFKLYKNNELTEKTKVYTLTNRGFFQFVLPSGTIVNVRSGTSLLDVWIKPSALDFGHTSGLCGTYDGDTENDLTMSDGTVEALDDVFRWRGDLLPFNFVNSWRPDTTLFRGVPESESTLPSEVSTQKCVCINSTCTPTDIVETCDFILGEDITSELELYTQIVDSQSRRKRQTENVWDTIDFNADDPSDQFPTWPTDSGYTEVVATQICETALQNHASWDICSVAIDTTSIVSSCVTDILLSDSVDSVSEYVEDMKVQCKLAVLSDPSIAAVFNQSQEDFVAFLLTMTCVNDCSNHGNCVSDICQCDTGYQGDDCSDSVDTAPAIASLSENIYSGTTGAGLTVVTRQVTVFGSGFENSATLSCHAAPVEVSSNGYINSGATSSSKGTFLTAGTLLCDVSGSLPLTGILLSVSNNGVNQSNNVMYIFQDEVCYDCDPGLEICNLQPTSCVIGGQCYAAGDYNPTDQCLVCHPVTNVWTFKPSSSCTATSTSTTTSTTSSTTSSTSSSTSTTSTASSKTSSPSSTSSSSSTLSTSTKTTSTSPSTSSTSSTTGDDEGQGGEEEASDQETFNIVIITGACVGALIIIVIAVFAVRLRRKDKKASVSGSTMSSSEPPKKRGQTNPGYDRGEPRPIAGDPVIQPRRITDVYSANFTTEGLQGRSGAPVMYQDDPGMQTVNIAIFDENREQRVSADMPVGPGAVGYDVVYDNAGLERQYTIPRPYVEPSPAGLYPEVRRQVVDADYDHVTTLQQRPIHDRNPPMPDYYEDDGSDNITKM